MRLEDGVLVTGLDWSLFAEVLAGQERRLELAMEGFRYIDLIRWGNAPSVLGDRGFVENKHEVYPIPQDEILNSNNTLIQNDNY